MHETMVAQSIFDTIIDLAKEHHAKPVKATISCGQFNPIHDEILNAAFEVLAKGTICESMQLEVKHILLNAECKKCGKTFDYNVYNPGCPECDSMEFDFKEDAPLLLENIELEPITE